VKEAIHLLIMFALLLGLIIGGEKFFKDRHTVTVAPTDASMNSVEFTSGSYKLDVRLLDISQLKTGDVIAFRMPGEAAVEQIARVAAIQGQRISSNPKEGGLLIDNAAARFTADSTRTIPEFRVPRGCVFVVCDNPMNGTDSANFGPLPFHQIIGKVVR